MYYYFADMTIDSLELLTERNEQEHHTDDYECESYHIVRRAACLYLKVYKLYISTIVISSILTYCRSEVCSVEMRSGITKNTYGLSNLLIV